jgi:hypothetical protein
MVTLAYDFTASGATFNPPAILRFSYDPALIPAGVAAIDLQIAYYDGTRSAWVTLPCTYDVINHFITAEITHFTPYAITYGVKFVPPPLTTTTTPTTTAPHPITTTTATTTPITPITTTTTTSITPATTPATVSVSKLTISPAKAKPGQAVTITVQAQNTGEVTGPYLVILKIDSTIEDSKLLNLAAGTKHTVPFTASLDGIGEHTVDVNGLTGKFTVVTSTTIVTPPPVKTYSWIIFVGIGAFLLTLIATIIVGLRRR